MRRLFAVLILFVLLFAFGCATNVVNSEPVKPAPVPALTPVQPGVEKAPVEVKPVETPAVVESPVETSVAKPVEAKPVVKDTEGTLGSRIQGTNVSGKDESVPDGATEIKLNVDKTMSEKSLTVSSGDTLYWKNYDSWPHVLAVETGKGYDTKRWAKSEQLLEGNVWKYTFNDKGTFLVRDVFSGSMRMNVTVE